MSEPRPCQEDHTPNKTTRDALDAVARGEVEPFEFSAGGQPPSDGMPSLTEVMDWIRGRPGVSWLATLHDIERAVTALRRAAERGVSAVPPNQEEQMSDENEATTVAQPKEAQTESVLRAREAHMFDLYDALGVRWGDDPFARIAALRAVPPTEEPNE